jgi:uncharacterized protein (DUF1015 family)
VPELQPFRGIRYSPDIDLSLATSPPYDLISEEERSRLAERHEKNFVHLILPPPEEGEKGYESAGEKLRAWLEERTLVRDPDEMLYVYRSDYRVGDRETSATAGIVGALRLEEFGKGAIFPHERTMPGPKIDRLKLMRYTNANLEPLWFVSGTHLTALNKLVHSAAKSDPIAEVADRQGVKHRLWQLASGDAEDLADEIHQSKLVIADGHHRYETALTYRDERRRQGPRPWDYTLALIVDPFSLGPTLLPIHRVARGSSVDNLSELVPLEPFDGDLEELERHIASDAAGLVGVAAGDRIYTIRVEGPIATAFLDAEVFGRLPAQVAYEHDLKHLEREVRTGAMGFVLAPVAVETVIEFALAGRRMPPKTTLFWPKPLSGLVVRDISIGG